MDNSSSIPDLRMRIGRARPPVRPAREMFEAMAASMTVVETMRLSRSERAWARKSRRRKPSLEIEREVATHYSEMYPRTLTLKHRWRSIGPRARRKWARKARLRRQRDTHRVPAPGQTAHAQVSLT